MLKSSMHSLKHDLIAWEISATVPWLAHSIETILQEKLSLCIKQTMLYDNKTVRLKV